MRHRCRHCGVTLVELLAVMAVVAILATLAYPSFLKATQRAHRLDARLALQRIQYLQERHYAEHLRYAERLGGESGAADALAMPERTDSGSYVLSVTAGGDGQSFVALAAASHGGRQASDSDCQQFAVDEAGRRRSADAGGTWTGTDMHRCWG